MSAAAVAGYVARVRVTGLLDHPGANFEYLYAWHDCERKGICVDPGDRIPEGCRGWSSPVAAKAMFETYAKTREAYGGDWEYLETRAVDVRGRIIRTRKEIK